MKTPLLCLLAFAMCLLLSGFTAMAQETEIQVDREKLNENQIVSLTLHAAQEPVPAMKYRLLPDQSKLADRNAVLYYHRAIHVSRSVPAMPELADGDDTDRFNAIFGCPLDEFPVAEVKAWLVLHHDTLAELDRAARSGRAEWGVFPEPDETGIWFTMQLDEIQEARPFARMLALKAKLEIAEGRYDDAIMTLGQMYKIGNDVAQSGTLVGDLVAIAVVGIANEQALELIEQPDAPSLYWAVANLPKPLVDSRRSIATEFEMIHRGSGMSILNQPQTKSLAVNEWRSQLFNDADLIMEITGMSEPPVIGTHGVAAAMMVRGYPIAKHALIENGMDAAKVEAMPVVQVIAIHQQRINQQALDEASKILSVPLRDAIEMSDVRNGPARHLEFGALTSKSSVLLYLELILPAIRQVIRAECRSNNRLASLQIIEAIRLHIGQTGELPESLDDVTIVPLPKNTFTGEAMRYEKTDSGATLFELTGDNRSHQWKIYDLKVGEKR